MVVQNPFSDFQLQGKHSIENPRVGGSIPSLATPSEGGAAFRSLTESIDTTTSAGRMMLQMLGAFAEFERGIVKKRTRLGLQAARRRGRVGGRQPNCRHISGQRLLSW